ncbi:MULTISPECIES: hypothetical protein [Pontibacillus]|uniref:Uncharacterized protein n=1 Tax=Pontibacillus chungwhensis TaxID=265426 RepID=A0ABY8V0V3_9BACI|nr:MULTISPECIES: hypothetical protein [Pontibacillus]MCD5324324.1 hypothetical protein [Pontibacillus sp. HN14]WIF99379.1 hypothetical protein QNI29_06895 [Pontibacillus chungwhensis]
MSKEEAFDEFLDLLDTLEELAKQEHMDPTIVDHILTIRYYVLRHNPSKDQP